MLNMSFLHRSIAHRAQTLLGVSLAAIIASGILFSCSFAGVVSEEYSSGQSLVLAFSTSDASARTIAPSASDIGVSSYAVTLSKGSSTVSDTVTSQTASFSDLAVGTWTVAVSGLNASGSPIATGSASIAITSGQTASASIPLSLVDSSGTGSMKLTFTIPSSAGITAASAVLGSTAVTPTVATDAATALTSITLSASGLPVGSSLLRLTFFSDSAALGTVAESVWVYTNVTTTATVTLSASDLGAAPAKLASLSGRGLYKTTNTVVLKWTDATASVADGYIVSRSETSGGNYNPLATLDYSATSYLDTGLTKGTTYYYKVTPYNRFGSGLASAVTVTAGVAPKVVSCGQNHALILMDDGSLYGVGSNSQGQLGLGSTSSVGTPTLLLTDVASMVAEDRLSFVLKNDGTLWACGYGANYRFGSASTSNVTTFIQIASSLGAIKAFSVSDSMAFAVTASGALYATGLNTSGAAGLGSVASVTTWTAVPTSSTDPTQITGVVSVATNGYYNTSSYASYIVKTDGTLWSAGNNTYGQLANGTTINSAYFTATGVSGVKTVVALVGKAVAYLDTSGYLWGAGDNSTGLLGNDAASNVTTPVKLVSDTVSAVASTSGVTPLSSSTTIPTPTSATLIVKSDRSLWASGTNTNGIFFNSTTSTTIATIFTRTVGITGVISASVGTSFGYIVKNDGTVWSVGDNGNKQLGNGDATKATKTSPQEVTF
jgi:alpha-tubulin suppressor-like RCC1 family protein